MDPKSSEPLHVAQVVSGVGLNGAIRHCYELTCELAMRGVQVTLVHRPGAWIAQQALPENVVLYESSVKRKWSELKRVANDLKGNGCNILHSHLSSAHFFSVLLARIFGFKSIATSHMPHFQPHWWWNDRIIAPCTSTMTFQRWVNGVPKRRIDVIPNFINPDRFVATQSRENMRAELGIEDSQFAIAVIGTVEPRKGMHYLIPAIAELVSKKIDPVVISAGPLQEAYHQRLIADCQRLGIASRVRFLGRRSDIPNLLAGADCVCLPSEREVMPISLLEAMSCHIPVVATRVGGVPDCIRHEIDGLLIPPKDITSLTDALLRMALNPALRKEMGTQAGLSMREHFSPRELVPQIIQVYERVGERASSAPSLQKKSA